MTDQTTLQPPSEHIVEIRYTPNPKLLDYRGTLADALVKDVGLTTWLIRDNRVDLFNDQEMKSATINVFASFRNAGVVMRDGSDMNAAATLASQMLKALLARDAVGHSVVVERVGVRSRIATPYAGTFEELVRRYTEQMIYMSPNARALLEGEGTQIIDIGIPVDFALPVGKLKTVSGPMAAKQLAEFFSYLNETQLPKVALYTDLDRYVEKNEAMHHGPLAKIVYEFAVHVSKLQAELIGLVLG